MTQLVLRNCQRIQPINLRLLRRITSVLLETLEISEFDLGIYFVPPSRMAQLNEAFLSHTGSTDVLSFHYPDSIPLLCGEIFISVSDAKRQAREYRTTWQSEVVRYLIHGILHLDGYDDLEPRERRVMKRKENQLLREISRQFSLWKLGAKER